MIISKAGKKRLKISIVSRKKIFSKSFHIFFQVLLFRLGHLFTFRFKGWGRGTEKLSGIFEPFWWEVVLTSKEEEWENGF